MTLIGRRGELAAVEQLLDAALRGSGGHLVVTGPAGAGKTALLNAAADLAEVRGVPVHRTAATAADAEQAAGLWNRMAGEFGAGGPPTDAGPAERDRTARAIAGGGPRLVLVDDLDRAGRPAADFLSVLAPRLVSGGTVLIATTRRPLGVPPERQLAGLAQPDLARLIPGLSSDAVHAVWLVSGGLPGVALERARDLAHRDEGPAGTGPRAAPDAGAEADAVAYLALTAPSRAEFLELDTGLIRLLESAASRSASPPAVRARVLARLARELLGDPSAGERRRRLIEEALSLARSSGDPGTTAEVLDSGLHALWDPAAADERLATASEIVEQARRAGDAVIERRGLFWRFVALTEQGELGAAEAALTAYARAGELAGDAEAAVVVRARQSMLETVRGRFDAAEALAAEVAERGRAAGIADTDRLVGALQGSRAAMRGEFGALVEPWQQLARRLPGHFFEATAARALVESGRDTEAGLELERLLPAVLAGSGPRWVGVVADLSFVASRVGEPAAARALYDALLPYRGRLVVWGGANTLTGPVDDYLGRLATRLDRPDLALSHLDAATAVEQRIGALPWLAATLVARAAARSSRDGEGDRLKAGEDLERARSIAERLGLTGLSATLAPPPDTPGEWRLSRDGDDWLLDAGPERARLRDSRGMEYLRALVAVPGQEIAALDLVAGGAGLRAPDGDPLLDETARTAYRRRLETLAGQLDAADRAGDAERAAVVEAERTALLGELRRATGLGGRPRTASAEGERARVNATRALRAAVKRIESAAPLAGAHLRASLRTGRLFRYQPAPGGPSRWRV